MSIPEAKLANPTLNNTDLSKVPSVVIRQKMQTEDLAFQALGIPFDVANVYKISLLDPSLQIKQSPNDQNGYEPTHEELAALPALGKSNLDLKRNMRSFIHCILSFFFFF